MKKIITLLMLMYISIASFATVNDNLKLLKEDQKIEVENQISKVEKESGLNITINYINKRDIKKLDEIEKNIIINFIREDDNTLKVSLNFTQDVKVDEYIEEFDKILENLQELMNEGKKYEYTIELVESMGGILEKSKKIDEESKNNFRERGGIKTKILLLLIIMFGIYLLKKRFGRRKSNLFR